MSERHTPDTSTGWSSGAVLPVAHCVLAPNAGPMTLDGTNTWVVGDLTGGGAVVVIDPGPDDERHWSAVHDLVEQHGARVEAVLLTHGHLDHSEAAAPFARRWGVGVRCLDPKLRLGSEGLVDGDTVDAGGVRLDVLATPGHTRDSLSFVLPDQRAVLTGDSVLGRGTAVIDHPDGVLGDYLDSLRRLAGTIEAVECEVLMPGHGPALDNPAQVIDQYRRHRAERIEQVRSALAAGARTPSEVVQTVYADVPQHLWPIAERSVRATLEYLDAQRS